MYLYNNIIIIFLVRTDALAVRGPDRHPVRARIVYLPVAYVLHGYNIFSKACS